MPRMKVTITGYYEADPKYYDPGSSPAEMAAVDSVNVEGDPIMACTLLDDEPPATVEITPDA